MYKGRVLGDDCKVKRPIQKIVGSSNEADVKVDGKKAKALVDTGSGISTISEKFYRENLQHRELQSLYDMLQIECANGESLPYLGFVEVDFESDGIPIKNAQTSIFLIVPDTTYNLKTPILVGTNILRHLIGSCRENFGERFVQTAALYTPWFLAFRSMAYQEKTMKRNNNRLAIVRSAENSKIIIKPNSNICIKGYIDTRSMVHHPETAAIFDHTEKSCLPIDLDIVPTCFNYSIQTREVNIHISNVTTRMVSVQSRSILCEIQPEEFSNFSANEMQKYMRSDHLKNIDLGDSILTNQQKEYGNYLENTMTSFLRERQI